MNEMSFGAMLAFWRKQANKTAAEVVPFFKYASPTWLSEIESNSPKRGRPSKDLIDQFARIYRLGPIAKSYLLRAADYAPSLEEMDSYRLRMDRPLAGLPDAACVIDCHNRLVSWNSWFADLYDEDTTAADTQEPPALPYSQSTRTSSIVSSSSPNELPLSIGLPFLQLVYSKQSRLRREIEVNEWRKLAHYAVVYFLRSTLPVMRPGWYRDAEPEHEGEPQWLRELLDLLEFLPDQAGAEFRRELETVREQLQNDPHDASVDLVAECMPDTVIYWQGRRIKLLVEARELEDARFTLVRFTPIDGTSIVRRKR